MSEPDVIKSRETGSEKGKALYAQIFGLKDWEKLGGVRILGGLDNLKKRWFVCSTYRY